MNDLLESDLVLVFGATGFVGKHLMDYLGNNGIAMERYEQNWYFPVDIAYIQSKKIIVAIAAGGARFRQNSDEDSDKEIVKNIINFCKENSIFDFKLIYVSSLAAEIKHKKNQYGKAKEKAESFVRNLENYTIWRAPALYGSGMSSESHINWFVSKKIFMRILGLFSKSGITVCNIDDFASFVFSRENLNKKCVTLTPESFLVTFKNLDRIIRNVHCRSGIQAVSNTIPKTLRFLIPFQLQPLFYPLWVANGWSAQINKEKFDNLINHIRRVQGKPTQSAPVVVLGAGGGLGTAVCKELNTKKIAFIAVDVANLDLVQDLNYCIKNYYCDFLDDHEWNVFLTSLDLISDISWIITAAGKAVKGNINSISEIDRSKFWKLMITRRLDILAWAQNRSIRQNHIGVINISSSTSFIPFINYPEYSAANAAIRIIGKVGIGDFENITLHTIIPGGMRTNLMQQYGNLDRFHKGAINPDVVAEKIIEQFDCLGNREICVGKNVHMLKILNKMPFESIIQTLVNNKAIKER